VIRIHLTDAEANSLEQTFRHATDRKHLDRLQIVRLAHRGRKHLDIACDLGITPRTVQRWLNAYLGGGLDALRRRKAKGKAPAIPAHMADEIRRWVIAGPAEQGLDRANWTHAELADHLRKTHGISASRSAMQRFCRKAGVRLYRPTYRFLRGDPVKQAEAVEELADLRAEAEAGELVLLSQDEARFPMVPTLGATLGVKGHRPTVGTRDCKDLLSTFAVVNVVTASLHSNLLESPARAKQKTGKSKVRRLQEAFTAHLRHVARLYPAGKHRQRPVAPGQADRRGPGRGPAPGVPAAAQLQPSAQRDRAILEAVASPCHAQPAVREPGGAEDIDPGQPVLLPDGPG